VACTAKSTA